MLILLARPTGAGGIAADAPFPIERIIAEAASSIESDRTQRERVDLQNKLVSLVRNTQRSFLEFSGLLSKETQEAGQQLLAEGEGAIKSQEIGEVRLALDGIERLGRQLTTAMMEQSAQPQAEEGLSESE